MLVTVSTIPEPIINRPGFWTLLHWFAANLSVMQRKSASIRFSIIRQTMISINRLHRTRFTIVLALKAILRQKNHWNAQFSTTADSGARISREGQNGSPADWKRMQFWCRRVDVPKLVVSESTRFSGVIKHGNQISYEILCKWKF